VQILDTKRKLCLHRHPRAGDRKIGEGARQILICAI
jgi:hypothetical protein